MERIVHKSCSPQDADAWDIEQYRQLTLAERLAMGALLRRRAYGTDAPDLRDEPLVHRTTLGALR